MRDTEELVRALAAYLEDNGLEAAPAWGGERRARPGTAAAAVSLRKLESGQAGFQGYLGERYDPDADRWEELYGGRMELTFGLDLYGGTAEEVRRGLDRMRQLLSAGGPEGMLPAGLWAGETVFRPEEKHYFCPVQARYQVWTAAAAGEESTFLDFEVKGTRST